MDRLIGASSSTRGQLLRPILSRARPRHSTNKRFLWEVKLAQLMRAPLIGCDGVNPDERGRA